MLLDLPARRTRMNTYNLPASKNGRKRIVDVAYLLKEQYPSAKFTLQYDSISHERMRHVDGRKLKEDLGGDHFIGDFVQDLRNTCAYLDHYADENMFRRAYHAAF